MPPATFAGVVTKCGAMNKTVTVTVSRMATHKKTGKVPRRHRRHLPRLTDVAAGIAEDEKVSYPRRVERCALQNHSIRAYLISFQSSDSTTTSSSGTVDHSLHGNVSLWSG
jgi:hypothetical protein